MPALLRVGPPRWRLPQRPPLHPLRRQGPPAGHLPAAGVGAPLLRVQRRARGDLRRLPGPPQGVGPSPRGRHRSAQPATARPSPLWLLRRPSRSPTTWAVVCSSSCGLPGGSATAPTAQQHDSPDARRAVASSRTGSRGGLGRGPDHDCGRSSATPAANASARCRSAGSGNCLESDCGRCSDHRRCPPPRRGPVREGTAHAGVGARDARPSPPPP